MARNLAQLAQLDDIGSFRSEFDTELTAAEAACGDFIRRVKENIQSIPDFVNTGKIEHLYLESAGDEIHIKGNPVILWQYRGAKGSQSSALAPDSPYAYTDKRPPIQPFINYIQSKNIRLIHNEKYYGNPSPFKEVTEAKQQESLAWAMSTKVFLQGYKPHPEIKWDEEKEKLRQDLIANAKGFVIGKLKSAIYDKEGNNVDEKGK